ncbi:hypothetical protein Xsze_04136 [Xenorhabdus szentirmaii DSM 16338]|nr:hypothetical protein Xsze_04136 [Xenorhabdus szentirmaii DSM 16338]
MGYTHYFSQIETVPDIKWNKFKLHFSIVYAHHLFHANAELYD